MTRTHSLAALLAVLIAPACGGSTPAESPAKPLAQKAEKLEVAKPKTLEAQTFVVASDTAEVGFLMEAPIEKIRGKLPGSATTGSFEIDLADIRNSAGIVHVDLAELELFQRQAEDDGEFGEEVKNELQNEHARAWLEIDESTPETERKKNELVEFSLTKVKSASATNVLELEGSERKIEFEAEGEFLLHQRKSKKQVKLEATFVFDNDVPISVQVRTVEPFGVDLAEHDVRPRTAFATLAQKTLSTLSDKVAQVAEIELAFTAERKDPSVATNLPTP